MERRTAVRLSIRFVDTLFSFSLHAFFHSIIYLLSYIMKTILLTKICFLLIAFCGAGLLFVSCKSKPDSPVVARVGNRVLTLDELYKTIPPGYSEYISKEQLAGYVKRWIDNTILYNEALRLHIDKEDAVRAKLERMKVDLLCAEMMNRQAVPVKDVKVSAEMMEQYYNENKEKFVRDKGVAKFLQIAVDDAAIAQKVRALVTPDNFLDLATKYSRIAPPADSKNIPYVKYDAIPPECAQEISTTRIGGTTQIVKTSKGFFIFRVLDKQPKGTICQLDEVKDDIVGILAARMQDAGVEQLITSLRSKMIVEIHLETIDDKAQPVVHDTASIPLPDSNSADSVRKGN